MLGVPVDTDVSILCCMFVDRQRQFTIVEMVQDENNIQNEWRLGPSGGQQACNERA
jgi:hypothetical protein